MVMILTWDNKRHSGERRSVVIQICGSWFYFKTGMMLEASSVPCFQWCQSCEHQLQQINTGWKERQQSRAPMFCGSVLASLCWMVRVVVEEEVGASGVDSVERPGPCCDGGGGGVTAGWSHGGWCQDCCIVLPDRSRVVC